MSEQDTQSSNNSDDGGSDKDEDGDIERSYPTILGWTVRLVSLGALLALTAVLAFELAQPAKATEISVRPKWADVRVSPLTGQTMVPADVILPTGESVLDINEVMRILPHRYPFLLVDRIVDFLSESKCTGVKNITINEPFFQGHFPNHPIMPGVLQLEAMAQVSSVLMLRKPENTGKIGYFMSANNVKWRRPVLPGDTLFIETELLKMRGSIGQTRCRCLVNGELVSEAELKFALLDR